MTGVHAGAHDHGSPGTERLSLGWVLGVASFVLIVVVGLMTYVAIERSESAMASLLEEKGVSLIRAFEGVARTGIRSDTGLRLQVLLEEMARSPDIEFVALTMPDGTIVAHSSQVRLGEILRMEGMALNDTRMKELNPGPNPQWAIMKMEGRRVFVVYRDWMPDSQDLPDDLDAPSIFLGLDVSPFEIIRSQNRSYVIMLSIVTLLVGLLCLVAVCYAQRARESRNRQHVAEGEVHRLEEEVRRNEKMAAIGSLAAGVAHEIRNPLSSIKGYATYFGQRFPEGSDDRQAAEVMVREVNRLNRVVTDLIGLSRSSDVSPRSICLESVVAHVMRLIRQTAERRGVSLEYRASRHVPNVLADAERMGQALLNLCLNAMDAMPEGGRMTLALARGRGRVCLVVRDTGRGIAPAVKTHIFDPYFTTRRDGTGLGLALVHKIVAAHNGLISVSSRLPDPDGGPAARGETIFRIWLPQDAGSGHPRQAQGGQTRPVGRRS